jgi:hypothetical protein
MNQPADITEKVYRKLLMEVGLRGFSFAVLDTLINRIETVQNIDFATYTGLEKVTDFYWKAFLNHKELIRAYDEIVVSHQNCWNTFVPKPLFEEEFLGSYLQFNTKVFETDTFAFDALKTPDVNNVFVPFADINNFLLDQFDVFQYKHSNTILVEKLLEQSKNFEGNQIYVHVRSNSFEIVICNHQGLLFFNSFEFSTKEDFLYYILFSMEQLSLNPEKESLVFLGDISAESELYTMAYQYIRDISFLEVSHLQKRNNFTTAQNLKHFILFQS